jgi:hypothetical protein
MAISSRGRRWMDWRRRSAEPYRSVEREREEELFGREDANSVFSDSRQADPMHRSRLSAPMGWLTADHLDDQAQRMECTRFGFTCPPAITS